MDRSPAPRQAHALGGMARVSRPHLPDVRPLDFLRSLKVKLAILVTVSVALSSFITWVGVRSDVVPRWTFPLAITLSLMLAQILARGMTSPLRQMTTAARAMADGDYSRRVQATSRDEVGQLATAFNMMAQDLAQSDQVRRDLVANVSHELRTPLAALQAQLENIVDGVSPATPATMENALAQTERLTRLVTYLLDLSRLEAGASDLAVSTVLVGDFLTEHAEAVSLVEASKELEYIVDVTPEGLTIEGDRVRLGQVITNLLQNAIRHSPQGGVIRLDAYPVGQNVVIEVSDDGPGIAKEDRERIFQRFTQAHATSGGTGGTGIGLSIVRWAVALHGGRVEVADSTSGTSMRVTLPASFDVGSPAEPPLSPIDSPWQDVSHWPVTPPAADEAP